jgi:hypothetical protein
MTAVYSVAYVEDNALLAPGISDKSTSDVLLWCAPDFPRESDDWQRDGAEPAIASINASVNASHSN